MDVDGLKLWCKFFLLFVVDFLFVKYWEFGVVCMK